MNPNTEELVWIGSALGALAKLSCESRQRLQLMSKSIISRISVTKTYGDVDKRIQGDESKKAFAAPENAKRLAIVWKCMAAVVCGFWPADGLGCRLRSRDLELRRCDSALHHPPNMQLSQLLLNPGIPCSLGT